MRLHVSWDSHPINHHSDIFLNVGKWHWEKCDWTLGLLSWVLSTSGASVPESRRTDSLVIFWKMGSALSVCINDLAILPPKVEEPCHMVSARGILEMRHFGYCVLGKEGQDPLYEVQSWIPNFEEIYFLPLMILYTIASSNGGGLCLLTALTSTHLFRYSCLCCTFWMCEALWRWSRLH